MKKFLLAALSVLLFVSAFFAGSASSVTAQEAKILEFDTMVGVPRPYTGATNAIRGVPGGGLPWVVASAEGELKESGQLEVRIFGLVFDPNDPVVIERNLAGINTVPNFKAIVSCLSKDTTGNPMTVNVSTGLFPADMAGNSTIEAQVSLPDPCIAPIIFVTSPASATNPTGSWFAATGF
jgi:hypothetical protein